MTNRYSFIKPNEGKNYQWESDHTFVKVSAADTGGDYTLMEDNLKSTFALGLHRHETHAETFYILEGTLDFYVDGDWIKAVEGSCLHIPAGVPHACKVSEGSEAARMLMIFQPAGFDQFLAELDEMSESELNDPDKIEALSLRHDIINMGDMPEGP
jgi:quercetin dioxygenase-like cupin family protein